MVDATNKRQKVSVMGAVGHSGPLLYFMGHLREPGGMSVVLWGCFNAGPGQVRTVQRRDLQDGSCALLLLLFLLLPLPSLCFALLCWLAFLSSLTLCSFHFSLDFLTEHHI